MKEILIDKKEQNFRKTILVKVDDGSSLSILKKKKRKKKKP